MNSKKREIISLIINMFIFIVSLSSWIYMMIGDGSNSLSSQGLESLKYFTVLSNLYMGFAALFTSIYRITMLIKENKNMPKWIKILNLSGVTSIIITFLIVIAFLAPKDALDGGNFFTMYKGANLFFHLIIPLMSISNFLFIEHDCELEIKYVWVGVIPILIYGIFYITNFFSHWVFSELGGIKTYDWYHLLGNGNYIQVILIFIGFFLGTYLLTLLIWFLNKKLEK